MTVVAETPITKGAGALGLVWLDLTRKCQLSCGHCHNESGPDGTHGSMTTEDWTRVCSSPAVRSLCTPTRRP